MAKQSTAEFYVVFDADIYTGGQNPWIRKVRARRISQRKPGLAGGEIALKFQASIPDAAFLRLIPDVAIIIPDGFWTSQPIEVIVAPPDDAEGT